MLQVSFNKTRQTLQIRFLGIVQPDDFRPLWVELETELKCAQPGFSYLVDFSQFTALLTDCTKEIGQLMDRIHQAKVGIVIRVIPNSDQDIGMNIMAIFHYPPDLRVINCVTVEAAFKLVDNVFHR